MQDYRRFAVYYTPEPGPLADFTARWLGWDPAAGRARAHPDVPGLPLPVAVITATPRKYGFHGTIKPPFRLAAGRTASALDDALAVLATALAPANCGGLELSRIGGFLALMPAGDTAPLDRLVTDVLTGIDAFRAPPDTPELVRRRAAGLTRRQEDYLIRWGYPYVLDEFRFHLTLSGPLDGPTGTSVLAALAPVVTPLLPDPFVLRDLCLCGEDDAGFFHILKRYPLSS
jgi:hypothetical protein